MLVTPPLRGAGDDQQVLSIDQGRGIIERLQRVRPSGDTAGLKPVQRVHAVEQHQEAPFVSRFSQESLRCEIRCECLILRIRREIGGHPEEPRSTIVDDVELVLATGQRVKLSEPVVQRFAVVVEVAYHRHVGRGVAIYTRSQDNPYPAAHIDYVRLEKVIAVGVHPAAEPLRGAGIGQVGRDPPGSRIHQVLREIRCHRDRTRANRIAESLRVGSTKGPIEPARPLRHAGCSVEEDALEERHGIAPCRTAIIGTGDSDALVQRPHSQEINLPSPHEQPAGPEGERLTDLPP